MWQGEILLKSFRCKYNGPLCCQTYLFEQKKAKSRRGLQVQLLMGRSEVWISVLFLADSCESKRNTRRNRFKVKNRILVSVTLKSVLKEAKV